MFILNTVSRTATPQLYNIPSEPELHLIVSFSIATTREPSIPTAKSYT